MSSREVLKNIIKFGKREYNEKKPLNMKVLRVKSKSILKRGMLPNLNVKQIQGTHFVVVADYGEYLRIYSFNRDGMLYGGDNIEKTQKFTKELLKRTTLEYHLPKEKPKLTIAHITRHYRTEFEKTLRRLNSLFGFNLRIPYTILSHKDLHLRMGRTIGCAIDRKNNALIITPEVYKKDLFEIIVLREIMYLYLRDLIVPFQDIEGEIVYWYDLAILFTNFYLKNEKNEYLRNLMEKTTISFLNFADGNKFYFSDKVVKILQKNTKVYSTKEANILLINVFECLKRLKKYQIKLRYKEFANLFFELCELFLEGHEINFFKPAAKSIYYYFHCKHFQKTLEMDKDSEKALFLCIMFSFLSNHPLIYKSLDLGTETLITLKNIVQKFLKNPVITKDVIGRKKLIEDAFIEYILNNIIEINHNYETKGKSFEMTIDLTNNSEFVFQNIEYEISWKPKNRISLIKTEEKAKSRDLHERLSKKYYFLIETYGNISLFCNISFSNPFEPQKRMKKSITLLKIKLRN